MECQWLPNWKYRKRVTISRASGAVTNYQLKLKVGESSGATGENVDCEAKCKTDFSDLRFTSLDGITLLNYWIEKVTGTTPNQLAHIWIKFDSIETSSTTFFMYYGNTSATAVSSITNTMDRHEGFEDGTIGLFSNYYSYDYFTIQSTVKYEGTYAAYLQDPSSTRTSVRNSTNLTFLDTDTKALEFWFYLDSFDSGNLNVPYTWLVQSGVLKVSAYINTDYSLHVVGSSDTSICAGDVDTWYKIVIELGATTFNAYVYNINLALLGSATGLSYGTGAPAYTCADVGMIGHRKFIGTAYWDLFYSRKYSEPEPAWGSWELIEYLWRRHGFTNFQDPGVY